MTLRLVAGAVVLALVGLTGCESLGDSGKTTLPEPLPKASVSPAPRPVDRSQAQLMAALTQVDACALLDPAKAKAPGFTTAARLRRTAPHQCVLEEGKASVRVDLGTTDTGRYNLARQDLAGAKGYLIDSPEPGACQVLLPISFKYSVSFYGLRPGATDTCVTVARLAGAAVPVLARPKPAKVGLAGWAACHALELLLGPAPSEPYHFSGVRPDATVDGCDNSSEGPRTSIAFSYDTASGKQFNQPERLAGKTVGVLDGKTACIVTWNQMPSGERDPRHQWVRVDLMSLNCPTARRLSVKLMKLLAGPEPAAPAIPQKPLLYRSDEPDSPIPGACSDLPPAASEGCEPYQPTESPKGAVQVYQRGKRDGQVMCAVSMAAVQQLLGKDFRPVVDGRGADCVHVRPTHGLEVRVSVDDRLQDAPGAREVRLLGRPAKIRGQDGQDSREVQLQVEDGTGVVLRIVFTFRPPRGKKEGLDLSLEDRIEPLAQTILLNSF